MIATPLDTHQFVAGRLYTGTLLRFVTECLIGNREWRISKA